MASAVPFLLFVGWQPTKSAQDSTIIFLSKEEKIMRRLLPALLAGMLLLAGCSSSEADAASVTSAETSYAGASEAEQETQDVTLAKPFYLTRMASASPPQAFPQTASLARS